MPGYFQQTEIYFPVIRSLILTLSPTLVSPCLDRYCVWDISLVLCDELALGTVLAHLQSEGWGLA